MASIGKTIPGPVRPAGLRFRPPLAVADLAGMSTQGWLVITRVLLICDGPALAIWFKIRQLPGGWLTMMRQCGNSDWNERQPLEMPNQRHSAKRRFNHGFLF
jgi:hypothetical protein